MTSKEFYRRIEAYMPLNAASQLFEQHPDADYLYKVLIVSQISKRTTFCYDIKIFTQDHSIINDSLAVYFDRFDKKAFDVQVRYFKTFYSRCSKIQQELVRSSFVLDYLVKYVS